MCVAFTTTTIQILLDYMKFMWQSICKKKTHCLGKGRKHSEKGRVRERGRQAEVERDTLSEMQMTKDLANILIRHFLCAIFCSTK